VFPQIDTAAQAEAAVYKVRYAYSGGNRSISPLSLYDGITNLAPKGWTSETIADRNVTVICQIESGVSPTAFHMGLYSFPILRTNAVSIIGIIANQRGKLAVANAEAIAKTAGVDVLMVGVGDLKSTPGIPIRNPDGLVDESKFHEAMASLAATSKKTGVQLMIPAFRLNPGDAESLRHFKMIITSVDILNVVKHHRLDLARMKAALREEHTAVNSGDQDGCKEGHEVVSQDGEKDGHQGDYKNEQEELRLKKDQEEQKDEYKVDSGTES
jgi:2-keto-3-deoxy-L-rhamnonate aldolase RhmA